MARAVIFDVDGTLVDSNDLHATSWKETFEHYGKEVAYGELRAQIGKGADQYMPVFWSADDLERFGKEMAQYKDQLFLKKYLSRTKPFPGAKELIRRIHDEGKQVALASSSKSEVIDYYIGLLGIKAFINLHTTADQAKRSKPYPDIFAVTVGDLEGITVKDCLVVGDAPFDVEAANKLSIGTIALLCGGFPSEELLKAGALCVYENPADLLEHYDSSPLGGKL